MTYDEMQTAACARVTDYVDNMLWVISEIRKIGPGNDRVSDLLSALQEDAGRALAVNDAICCNELRPNMGRVSRIAIIRER